MAMDPRSALKVLISSSQFAEEERTQMIAAIPAMSEEDVVMLGKVLAEQKKAEVAAAQKAIEAIDEFMATHAGHSH